MTTGLPLDQIICGDALRTLRTFPDKSIDLVVTSPPYNIKNSTGNGMNYGSAKTKWNPTLVGGYENYGDNMPHEEYVAWQRDVLSECMRVITDDGAVFYNHKWRVQGGLLQDRADIVTGFPVRQIIIWHRNGGVNFNKSYFLPTYEVIYMITKPRFHLVPDAVSRGDVWDIAQDLNNDHPAPFPVELVDRIISSTDAQIILDPFIGSGTTAVSAKSLGRHYIGIDISQKYCDMAEDRVRRAVVKTHDYNADILSYIGEGQAG